MTIRGRILTIIACSAVMSLVVTGFGLQTISEYSRSFKAYDRAYEQAWRTEKLNHAVSDVVSETRGLYTASDKNELDGFLSNLGARLSDLDMILADWKAGLKPEERAHQAALEGQVRDFIAARREVLTFAMAGKLDQAHLLSNKNRAKRIELQRSLDTLVRERISTLATAKTHAEQMDKDRSLIFLSTCVIGISALVFATVVTMTVLVTRPLKDISNAIIKTANGDYSLSTQDASAGDIGDVWKAIGVLKVQLIEADKLRRAELAGEKKLREILLD